MNGVIDPIAFQIGGLKVYWYGIILGSAAVFGLLLALYESKRVDFDTDILMDLLIFAIPISIVGARLYFVLFHWDFYSANPSEIFAIRRGGIAIHGALIGAILTGYIFARKKGVSFLKLADIAAPSLLLGQAIGRWGNFMNQEAHGGPVSLEFLQNLNLPQFIISQMNIDGVYYHPTFLYESIWNILGVIFLIWLRYRNPKRGIVIASYFIWYSVGRFFIEGLRTDSLAFDGPIWLAKTMEFLWKPMGMFFEPGAMSYGNVRIAQLMSITLIIISAIYIVYRKFYSKDLTKYQD
ncbi:prolipoprotein diacylglyceryl transferase [Vulcanibacillus modesticaldus]|uniref:Phosphatidylglycerol--prolipoprotein diacylglyceryl transferase n=1 Tax=Vulcanibacillus modesticaldus TaxID=337097 RepID=A0A1D2YWV8_9BACI|nr:prolipoprotein diacylglyceryl transferase [Vulcanibacillus modesticaldus]OEG00113.1 prolipoprotein diacylglyceryl transferase [Vulcanibacillus modesticaldus]